MTVVVTTFVGRGLGEVGGSVDAVALTCGVAVFAADPAAEQPTGSINAARTAAPRTTTPLGRQGTSTRSHRPVRYDQNAGGSNARK
jgi:hypothetical protein